MNRIFFLVNRLAEFDFAEFLSKHLKECLVTVGETMPSHPDEFRLVVLWSYRKILREIPPNVNVILFHSSDLPDGKGWAPIYHAMADGYDAHTICGIFAAPEVDNGDIIVKARFRIQPYHTASILRLFDKEISIMMIATILQRFRDSPIIGMPQVGIGSYRPKRRPKDNEIDISRPFVELIPHLRACEKRSPAYFVKQGHKYYVEVVPEREAQFPDDLEITFPKALNVFASYDHTS